MTRKVPPEQLAHARHLYESGLSIAAVAEALAIPFATAQGWLYRSGVLMRESSTGSHTASLKRHSGIVNAVVNRYTAGDSEKSLAAEFSVSRAVIRRILVREGIRPRGRSESMYLRMEHTPADERRALTTAAHAFNRGRRKSADWLARQAIGKQITLCRVGNGEDIFAEWLRQRGLESIPQLAVSKYNLDLAIAPVAVEIHVSPANPLAIPRIRQRVKDLTELGWHIIYVWVTKSHFLSERAADDVVAFLQVAKSDPSSIGQYRVIRGSGQFVTSGRDNLD